MSTNNREFDFFALMASLEAHMLKDPNVRDASPSEALENYFSRKGKRSQRRKNAFRAQRHRRDVMAEKFDTTSKNDGILRKTYKDGYAKFESSHGRVKKEDKSNSYYCKHPRECRRIEAANSKLADYMQSDICLDLYDSVFDDDDDYDTYMGQLFYDNLVYFLCEESGWSEEDLQGIGIVEMMDIRLAFAQHISVVYREKICGPNPMAYIYVQDLEFHKTSSRLDLSLEDDKTKWNRPIKAFDMDAAIAATSAQKANYSGTVVCGNDSVKYIYKFGTVDHNYIDHFGFMGVAPLYGYWDGSMNNSGFDVIAHGQSIASNLIEEITGRKRHPSMNHLIGELIILNAPKDKFRVTADKSSLDKSDKTWSLIISDIKANSILPACKTDAGTLRDMYAMYAKRCSSCGLRFVRNYSVGSSTGTKAPAIIEVVLPDNSIGYYLLMCKANETKSGPSLRDAMPLISSMLMMESNGKRVLGAYFIADRFSNGFVQDVSRLVEPINRNRTDRFEIRVCDTNTPLVLAVPAVSAQAAPVNINVGITIKKTR